MQGVTCFDAAILRKDFDPTKVHVTYGIQYLVTRWLIGKTQAFRVAHTVVIENNSVMQRSTADQAFACKPGNWLETTKLRAEATLSMKFGKSVGALKD